MRRFSPSSSTRFSNRNIDDEKPSYSHGYIQACHCCQLAKRISDIPISLNQTKVLIALSGLKVNVDGPEMTSPATDTPAAAATGEKRVNTYATLLRDPMLRTKKWNATLTYSQETNPTLSLRFFGEEETVC